jgi:hypothetical protein
MRKIVGLISLLFLLSSHSAMADVNELLEKIAEAYGGQKRIAEVTAYQQTGVTFSAMRGVEGDILRSYRHPDHLRVEIKYDEKNSELRILAGQYAWKQDQPAEGIFYSAMLLQAARLGLPAILFEHQKHVRDGGMILDKQGVALNSLELNFHGNYRLVVGVDPDTGRILESRGIIEINNAAMEFGTTYDDFRYQQGRLFAFKEVHYAMGHQTGHTHIESIEIVPDLPEELFHPSGLIDKKPEMMVMR